VEEFLSGVDLDAIIVHEVCEAILMSPKEMGGKGMKYEKAHAEATKLERLYRRSGKLEVAQQKVLDMYVAAEYDKQYGPEGQDVEDIPPESYDEGWPVEGDKEEDEWTASVRKEAEVEVQLNR
jgi:hypothetical protein